MSKKAKTVTINMDNRPLRVPGDLTILQAAQQNGIYIPTLCAHSELTPYGGCRMCIVEVEGMRGFPTACTTPVQDGMVIRTLTAGLQAERREILQLILSEHTSSCLICDQRDACRDNMGTIRKAGVTTGCRYCPHDDQCELQEVVESVKLEEINYPISYRHLPVEKDDPFYDRDYNLCILCGRCIRMCQEIRTANVLAFQQRGRHTVIGPAYHRTHLEAGCEFCGACVSVCPTGALAEKARKWDGPADKDIITTCALCGLGCQLRLLIKDGQIMGSLPAPDALVNRGQLCVKGRFCVSGLVNGHRRLKRPYRMEHGTRVELSWEEALNQAAEKLRDCPPRQFGMIISPYCTNEDLYAAQKFARLAMGSDHIETSARFTYGPAFNAYLDLFSLSSPLQRLETADLILCIGLDTQYGRSVAGVQIRRAMSRGAKLATIHTRDHNLALIADLWLQPQMGRELDVLRFLVQMTARKTFRHIGRKVTWQQEENMVALARLVAEAGDICILLGPEFLSHDDGQRIIREVARLARRLKAGVMPLPAQSNLLGSVLMGAYPELLPGGYPRDSRKRIQELERCWGTGMPGAGNRWNAVRSVIGGKLKVLYLVGEMLPQTGRMADFIIFQSIYPPGPDVQVDLVLPAVAFTETEGTAINGEGRLQRISKAVDPPGEALPDWDIFCRLARKMDRRGFSFRAVRQLQREMTRCLNGYGDFSHPGRQNRPLEQPIRLSTEKYTYSADGSRRLPLILYASVEEHGYREVCLADVVKDAALIFAQGRVSINPADAQKNGIRDNDSVIVSRGRWQKDWTAHVTSQQPIGTLQVTLPIGDIPRPNPGRVRIKRRDV